MELPLSSDIVGCTEDETGARIYCIVDDSQNQTASYELQWVKEDDHVPSHFKSTRNKSQTW